MKDARFDIPTSEWSTQHKFYTDFGKFRKSPDLWL